MSFKIGDEVVLNETGKKFFSGVKDIPMYSKIVRDMIYRDASAKIIERRESYWVLRMDGDNKNTLNASCDCISRVGGYKVGDTVRFSRRGEEYFKDVVAGNTDGWHPAILEMGKGGVALVKRFDKYSNVDVVTVEIDKRTFTTDKSWLFFNAKYKEVGQNSDLDNLSDEEIQKKIDSLTASETKISKEKNRASEVLQSRKEIAAKNEKEKREGYLKPLLAHANKAGHMFVHNGKDFYMCTKTSSDVGGICSLTFIFGEASPILVGIEYSFTDTNTQVFENSKTGEWCHVGLFLADSYKFDRDFDPKNEVNKMTIQCMIGR